MEGSLASEADNLDEYAGSFYSADSLGAHSAMTADGRHAQDGGKLMSSRSLCLYPDHVGTPEGWPR